MGGEGDRVAEGDRGEEGAKEGVSWLTVQSRTQRIDISCIPVDMPFNLRSLIGDDAIVHTLANLVDEIRLPMLVYVPMNGPRDESGTLSVTPGMQAHKGVGQERYHGDVANNDVNNDTNSDVSNGVNNVGGGTSDDGADNALTTHASAAAGASASLLSSSLLSLNAPRSVAEAAVALTNVHEFDEDEAAAFMVAEEGGEDTAAWTVGVGVGGGGGGGIGYAGNGTMGDSMYQHPQQQLQQQQQRPPITAAVNGLAVDDDEDEMKQFELDVTDDASSSTMYGANGLDAMTTSTSTSTAGQAGGGASLMTMPLSDEQMNDTLDALLANEWDWDMLLSTDPADLLTSASSTTADRTGSSLTGRNADRDSAPVNHKVAWLAFSSTEMLRLAQTNPSLSAADAVRTFAFALSDEAMEAMYFHSMFFI